MQRHPDPATSAAALAPLPARAWLLGYAVYASFAALALLVGGEPSPLKAATAGALSALPELAALRAHLNPHFVLNVLHALVGLATREPARTAECLERLGALLRYGLRAQAEGRDLVPLAEELAITRQYLEIERLRLGDRLKVELAVEEAAQSAEVPPFSLQPLVENAIRHAVAPRAGGGRVTIEIREEGGTLRLAVTDDGPAGEARPGEAGLGHSLLAERLRRLFGERAQLSARALAAGGFRAEVVITEGGEER